MNTNEVTIGLDLGDRRIAVCILSAGGEIVAEESITNTRECVAAFAQRFPGARMVMETGTHSPWLSRLLESLGHQVVVANARKLRGDLCEQNQKRSGGCADAGAVGLGRSAAA